MNRTFAIMRLCLPVVAMLAPLFLAACSDPECRPNIILVTVDTLRADRLGCYGCPVRTSPAVDALAARGVVFETCVAQASSTAPALASVMTSRYPSEVGVFNNTQPLIEAPDTIAAFLKRQGYVCAAFVSNFNLRPRMGFNRGFDFYDAQMTERELNRSGLPERTAEKTTDAALRWLAAHGGRSKPFFLWVHYQDPHGPYTPPDGFAPDIENYHADRRVLPLLETNWGTGGIPLYQSLPGTRDSAHYRACYDGEILFFDEHFGRLARALLKNDSLYNTAILFTADHGESMGEHGYWFSHEQDLFGELIHVPLIVAVPDITAGRRDDRACHLDILPTIATLVDGNGFDPSEYRGRDLFDSDRLRSTRPIFSETNYVATRTTFRSVIVGSWKLIVSSRTPDAPLLFDLENDGAETSNLARSKPDVASRMIKILEAEAAKSKPMQDRTAPLKLTPAEREALESLGYTGG